MVFNKKAISPVVATALLLVVAVVAVVGFQTWFNTYQSGQLSNVEQQSTTGSAISVERLENNKIYLKNSGTENVSVSTVSVGGIDCTAPVNFNATPGTAAYLTTNCTSTEGSAYDVVVVTADGVFQEKEISR